jgi:ATP-dependent RNA helicase RhlE
MNNSRNGQRRRFRPAGPPRAQGNDEFSNNSSRSAQPSRSNDPRFQSAPPAPVAPPRPAPAPEVLAASPFNALGLIPALVRAVVEEGYGTPTPVQEKVVPVVLAARDMLACAQTGTGKTAAFVLPLLQRLSEGERKAGIKVLILTPTRELASQIDERIAAYGRHLQVRHTVIFGGVNQRRQENALTRSPEIVVATPGRLLDLMRQGIVRLDTVRHLVLDEADRMLDMGFVPDVRAICATIPRDRQTLLFSATMPAGVAGLARSMLHDAVEVSVTPPASTAPTIEQSVMFVNKADRRATLERILADSKVLRAIIFTATKRGANRLAEQLTRSGIDSAAIHGDKSQGARERALEAFRRGASRVLIATDVASRGIDVDGISHVINFDLPNTPECYVHRIGRTGRAGATGEAISFCDPSERSMLREIERLIRRRLDVSGEAPVEQPAGASVNPGGARTAPLPPQHADRRPGRFRSGDRRDQRSTH